MGTEQEYDMIIEIPKGSNVKYEFDETTGQLAVDRIVQTPVRYFFNYGFFPKTLAPDGDPLDVVLLNCDPLYPMSRVRVKVLGMLETQDEHGVDNKIIAVPGEKVDPKSSCFHDLADLCHHTQSQIRYFFEHYKDLEAGKWIKVGGFKGLDDTLKHISECLN